MGDRVAAAVVHRATTKTIRLPNKASIFRAELHAISLALDVIRHSKEKNFIIFSDSMSSLEALTGFKLEIDIVQNIIKDYTHLGNGGKTTKNLMLDTQSRGSENSMHCKGFFTVLPAHSCECLRMV